MTNRERSAALRMAGNIASGIVAVAETAYSDKRMTETQQEHVAADAVSIALLILADPRLEVTEGE